MTAGEDDVAVIITRFEPVHGKRTVLLCKRTATGTHCVREVLGENVARLEGQALGETMRQDCLHAVVYGVASVPLLINEIPDGERAFRRSERHRSWCYLVDIRLQG